MIIALLTTVTIGVTLLFPSLGLTPSEVVEVIQPEIFSTPEPNVESDSLIIPSPESKTLDNLVVNSPTLSEVANNELQLAVTTSLPSSPDSLSSGLHFGSITTPSDVLPSPIY